MINELNVLYITKNRFKEWVEDHKTKIMFRFAFEGNVVTLTGWAPTKRDNSDEYDTNDILELMANSEKITLSGTRLYFGNIRLSKKEVLILRRASKPANIKYLLFIPMNYTKDKKQIAYEVAISETSERSGKKLFPKWVKATPGADPSPPATRK
jgi:hypothetical protein